MANTYTLIASSTVGAGGAASIDFTSIPSTYTDLAIKFTARTTSGNADAYVRFNGLSTNLSDKLLYGTGASTVGSNGTTTIRVPVTGSGSTANTFSNSDVYIPNYATAVAHSVSVDGVAEDNGNTANVMWIGAGLWNSATAITQVTLVASTSTFAQYSTAYLYGVKNA